MAISKKKLKQAKKLYPEKSLREIAGLLSLDMNELARALEEEGIEVKEKGTEFYQSGFPFGKVNWLALIIIGLCVVAVYLNSAQNEFHYDDYHSLTQNLHIRKLAIKKFFTDPQTFSSKPGVKMVRPILLTSFALNYAWTEYKAWSWLLVNVLIHLFNVLLVYVFLVHLSGSQKFAVIASLVFALHPANTESVNYINCRSTLLVTSFILLSLYGFVRSLLTKSWVWWGLCYLFFGLGFLVKEEAMVVLALGLVLDWLFLWKKSTDKNLAERFARYYLPFLLVTVLYFFYRHWALSFLIQDRAPRPFLENFFTQARVLVHYFNVLAFPIHLNASYEIFIYREFSPVVMFSMLYLLLWLVMGLYFFRRFPVFSLFVLWFFISLAPTTFIPLNATLNEHRLYLPVLGLGLLFSSIILKLEKGFSINIKNFVRGCLIFIFMLFSLLTVVRNRVWLTDMSLWRDTIRKSPTKAQVISDLGNAYFRSRPPNLDRAESLYKWSIRWDPNYFKAYHNIAIVNYKRGDDVADKDPELAKEYYQNAVGYFQQAINIFPWNPDSWSDLGSAYRKLNDYANAEKVFQRAIQLDPYNIKSYFNLCYVLAIQEKFAEAEKNCHQAIKIYDQDPNLWMGLIDVLIKQEKYAQALKALQEMLKINPNDPNLRKTYDRIYNMIYQAQHSLPKSGE